MLEVKLGLSWIISYTRRDEMGRFDVYQFSGQLRCTQLKLDNQKRFRDTADFALIVGTIFTIFFLTGVTINIQ